MGVILFLLCVISLLSVWAAFIIHDNTELRIENENLHKDLDDFYHEKGLDH